MSVITNYSGYYNAYNNILSGVKSSYGTTGSSNPYYTYLANKLGGSSYNYLNETANNALGYVTGLKSGSAALKTSLGTLASGFSKAVNVPVSSDADSMTVKSSGSPGTGGVSVKISQIAAGQVNEGTALKSGALVGQGYHKFAVEAGGVKHEFEINLSSKDTNEDMQNKMAEAINKANIGVTASVSKENGNSSLHIKSNETGDLSRNVFKLTDIAGYAVSKTGANNTTQEAQDAIYSVNGEQKTSHTNEISLGGGLTATLLKASGEEITVRRATVTDADSALKSVKNLVDSYNKLYETAVNNSGDSKAYGLFTQMVGVCKTYSSSLAKVGIGFDKNGRMTIDESKVLAAAEDGSLERFFTENKNSNYGFTNRMSQLADRVNKNTGSYVGSATISSGKFDMDTYLSVYSSALGSKTNSLALSGLLFNMSF